MGALREQVAKTLRSLRWLPAYGWQRMMRHPPHTVPVHLMIAVANHFEPEVAVRAPGVYADCDERERRVEAWCREYPRMADAWRDADGRPLRHTYFYPAENYDKNVIHRLTMHCKAGWGEIEIQLHHGVESPDMPENTRQILLQFRDALAEHGCLSRLGGQGAPHYAFVHGNWALANSARGRFCGVDEEMQILAETGCYADLTLPSAPDAAQVAKINALYECALPLDQRAPHRRGRDLRCGRPPKTFPLIIQGPLGLDFARRIKGWPVPCVENGALTALNPPTMHRLRMWCKAAIMVKGRPDWRFIKLHCHGMDPRDTMALLGDSMRLFLRELKESGRVSGKYKVHFVTAREMVNIILAACDGRDGDPGLYRDYRLWTDLSSYTPHTETL